jgi:hypothetical protein
MSSVSCHLGRWRTRSGTCARARRSWSSSQPSGRNSRQSIGQLAWSVAAWTLTPTWQLATLPSVPGYWRATPTEALPYLGKPVSSTIQASGSTAAVIRAASRWRTPRQSHGLWLTNCCSACSSPSGSRSAMGWTDLRLPSSINPRR